MLITWRALGCAVLVIVGAVLGPARAGSLTDLAGPSLGAGRASCASWLQHRSRNDDLAKAYAQWAWGYVSGYNLFVRSGQKHVFFWYDEPHILDLVDGYCRRFPDASVSEAMTAAFMQMYRAPRRLLPFLGSPGHWNKVVPPIGLDGQPLRPKPPAHR